MPTRFINPLLLLLVTANRGHLAKQIQYLKAENEVLRARLPKHIRTTPAERASCRSLASRWAHLFAPAPKPVSAPIAEQRSSRAGDVQVRISIR